MMSDNTTVTTTKVLSGQKVRLLTSTAIFAAMITLMTAYICQIPDGINGGYGSCFPDQRSWLLYR